MIRLKTAKEIECLASGGAILAEVLERLVSEVKAGVTPRQLDALAQELIADRGAKPSFLNYAPKGKKPFPAALCVSVNQAIVHGLPNDTVFKEGDVVGLDCGIEYKGLYTDSAQTVGVGKVTDEAARLMMVTRQALAEAIEKCRVGNRIGDIGEAVQTHVEREGFEVVRALVGHGVGYDVHEEPAVPNYGEAGKGVKLKEGLVIAIEPMVAVGNAEVKTSGDGWTVETKGGGLAAHEEHTVAIMPSGPRILTKSKIQNSNVK
ncbi:MAG: type I methionyl aminopeptidase [bacterium]